jgi:hypothetical protein
MIDEFAAIKLEYNGLLKLCHNCNLLVGFDYFVNAKTFWSCFDQALPAEEQSKILILTYAHMREYDMSSIPTLTRFLMDKFGIFFDLEKVASIDQSDEVQIGSQQFWLDQFDAMGSNSYLLCCWASRHVEPDWHVIRAQGVR